jgi:hypothetical protein
VDGHLVGEVDDIAAAESFFFTLEYEVLSCVTSRPRPKPAGPLGLVTWVLHHRGAASLGRDAEMITGGACQN